MRLSFITGDKKNVLLVEQKEKSLRVSIDESAKCTKENSKGEPVNKLTQFTFSSFIFVEYDIFGMEVIDWMKFLEWNEKKWNDAIIRFTNLFPKQVPFVRYCDIGHFLDKKIQIVYV